MNSTDFITTDGGERVDTRLHRAMVISDPACAPEGGEPHDPPMAKPSRVYRDDPVPDGYLKVLFYRALAIVALAAAAGLALAGMGA